jgi:hypothetical protein
VTGISGRPSESAGLLGDIASDVAAEASLIPINE